MVRSLPPPYPNGRLRQAEPEPRGPTAGLHANLAAGGFHQLLDDRKADPRPAARRVARLVHAIEAFEDPGQVVGRDAVAGVRNRDEDIVGAALTLDRHATARRRVAKRV